jgi:nitrogen fixation NifU-like protein
MSDPLYSKDLLRLAASAHGAGVLVPADAAGEAYNPICGDRVSVTLRMKDGHIQDVAHETRACVLTQASASILGARLSGADLQTVTRLKDDVAAMLETDGPAPQAFGDYAALKGAAGFRNRHTCVLLPIDAVLNALKR